MQEIEIEVPTETYNHVVAVAAKWKCTPDEAASIMLAKYLDETECVKVKAKDESTT